MKKNLELNERKAQASTRMQITNFIGVRVSYQGATDSNGSCVVLSLPRMSDYWEPTTITINYDHAENSCPTMAANYIREKTGLEPFGQTQCEGESGGCDLLLYEWHPANPLSRALFRETGHECCNNLTTILEKVFGGES